MNNINYRVKVKQGLKLINRCESVSSVFSVWDQTIDPKLTYCLAHEYKLNSDTFTMPDSPQFTCPICRKKFLESETDAFPFCSSRCRWIDLNRWFNEEYTVESFRRSDEEEDDDIPVTLEDIENDGKEE